MVSLTELIYLLWPQALFACRGQQSLPPALSDPFSDFCTYFLHFYILAALTAKFRRFFIDAVIMKPFGNSVPPPPMAAVHAHSVVSDFPQRLRDICFENEFINPKEDESSDQVGDNGTCQCRQFVQPYENNSENRCTELPAYQIEYILFEDEKAPLSCFFAQCSVLSAKINFSRPQSGRRSKVICMSVISFSS